jgi:uncharacterized protein (DUF924 family)
MKPTEVTDFWFGPKAERDNATARDFWFSQSAATDDEIRTRFGATVAAALHGELGNWSGSDEGALALILLLDQFTRNIHRGTAAAFAGDSTALSHARRLVGGGADRRFSKLERWFIYMPFEHSEQLTDQQDSLRLFGELAVDGEPAPLAWAQRHFEVIRRFGRFPHRNQILGRVSTPEEIEFLREPGSRF